MIDNLLVEESQAKTKSLGLRLKQDELVALNQRLKMDGFANLSDLVHNYIRGLLSKSRYNAQVNMLLARLREKNIADPITGEITPTFYKNVNVEDFSAYLKGRYHSRYYRGMASYYKRYADLFFTKPEIVQEEHPRKRMWICDAMRRFGDYYDFAYQQPEVRLLVREIIERYQLNKNTRMHDMVWVTDNNYLDNAIRKILKIFCKGDLATFVRFALFTGLRGVELEYVHVKPVCKRLGGCSCENLHIVNKGNAFLSSS